MEQVRRWDSGTVGKVERTDQGYLRAPATITKTGVFAYRLPGGKTRRELRLPDEVFCADTLASFGIAPLTNGHPPAMLNSRNTARYQVGSVVEPKQDGNHVAAFVQVTDADAIEAAEAGRRELSCGYHCDLEPRAGFTDGIPGVPDGQPYDAIQRNIRGNHVAMVDKGRAGSTVQLRLDGADAFQIQPDEQPPVAAAQPVKVRADGRPKNGAKGMEPKVRIDGVDYEATPQLEQAVGKLIKRLDDAETVIEDCKKFHAQEKARADAAEESLAAEKKARADAEDPARLRKAVDDRLALERVAGPILGTEAKLDEMADADIKSAVVLAVASDKDTAKARLDGCDAAYLQARFDAAVEGWTEDKKPNAGLAATRAAAKPAERTDSADDARKRMMERNRELGRKDFAAKEVH